MTTTTPKPSLKSILGAALPLFLFVCIALRLMNTWELAMEDGDYAASPWNDHGGRNNNMPMSVIKYALQHIVLGTTCCILASTSLSSASSSGSNGASSRDQSTLLITNESIRVQVP